MITREQVADYINQLLAIERSVDFVPNGLQVEGRPSIQNIVTGVTICSGLIEKAIAAKADAIIVHHGFFWKNTSPCLVGVLKHRIALLLNNDINLYAYHLPLDRHMRLGNNVKLARLLGISVDPKNDMSLLFSGQLKKPSSIDGLARLVEEKLDRKPLTISGRGAKSRVQRIAWCTGGGGDFIEEAVRLSADVFITGEITEHVVHLARELPIHLLVAGHHVTERYGVCALGNHLAKQFHLTHQFIDIDSPW